MKKSLFILCLVVLIFSIQGCQTNNGTGNATNKVAKKEAKYYCSMHASITADKPGTCPKCGMKLAERDTTGKK
ncbi:MAG: heavy metal-binding domain-containing protein [Mucilaginibacter sp.]